MKLTLIKPNIGRREHSLYVDEGRMEPLQLGVLAALTPGHVDVALCDDRLESIPYDEPTDLVAITVETFTARRAYEIAAAYRRRGVPVILGGFQPTLLPEEAAQHADSIFVGDAETRWAEVIADAEAGLAEFSVNVRNIGLFHADLGSLRIGPPNEPAVEIKSVRVDYSPRSLYLRKIKKLAISGIELHYLWSQGRFELPATTEARRRSVPAPLRSFLYLHYLFDDPQKACVHFPPALEG